MSTIETDTPPILREPEPPADHSARVVTGLRWSAFGEAATQGIRLAVSVVLARLLAPGDFGLLAMAHVFIALLVIFEDLGTASAIIQRERLSDRLLASLFTLNVCVGFLFAAGLFLAAPLLGSLYGSPAAAGVIRFLGLCFVFSSFGRVPYALLRREMRFDRIVRIQLGVSAAKGAVAIALAAVGCGVWALVAATLFAQAAFTGLYWRACAVRFRPGFSWAELRGVMGYSLSLSGFKLLNYLSRNADNFLIGRFLGAIALGLYDLAYQLYLFPLISVMDVLSRVLFPAFSRAQGDDETLRKYFLRSAGGIAFLTYPMVFGLVAVATPFVAVVLGAKWLPAVPVIVVLAPVGLVHSITSPAGCVYQAKGAGRLLLLWGAISSGAVTLSFFIGIRFGVTGVATAYAIAMFPLGALSVALAFPLIGLPLGVFFRHMAPYAAASAAMGIAVYGARRVLEAAGAGNAVILAACVPLGIALYAAVMLAARPPAVGDLLRVLRPSRAG